MFSSGCRRGILALGSGGGFNPLTLFAAGEQGGWWDPSDFSTMFQDSAGTTPVTAIGQPVGLIRDKSGRGNHRSQATAASRPTLQADSTGFYLLYDGVDDGMSTAAIDFTTTQKMTVWGGLLKASDATLGTFVELSASSTANFGTFAVFAPVNAAAPDIGFNVNGATAQVFRAATSFAAPIGLVVSCAYDLSQATTALQVQPRVNGAVPALTTPAATGTGSFGNYALFFGRRGGTTAPFNGREYASFVLGRAATSTEISQVERFIGSRMGIAL